MFTRRDRGVAPRLCLVSLLLAVAASAQGQNVVTQHNDISRTGANTSETVLTPSKVNTANFGKVFYYVVDGQVYAQPLYVANLTMGAGTPQAGTKHNVIFIATEHDTVYAFDADGNLGANAKPLWQASFLDPKHGAAANATPVPPTDTGETDIVPEVGITGTPVIDTATNTMYVVGKTKEGGTEIARLHALDITTGAEKLGGPVVISASVAGNGKGSVNGVVSFNALYANQRAGLLLLNGVVYIGFGSVGDIGPWHGWVIGYDATTLTQTGAWNSSRNGFGAGIWESGTGLTANVPDVNHPFGFLYTATGTGTVDPSAPFTDAMDYSVSVFKLDLNNGAPRIVDDFTPFDAATLTTGNRDQGSGGPIVLPDSVGGGKHLFMQVGKTGRIYIFDQNNLGGYHPTNISDPQAKASVAGEVYGGPAYWNGHIYIWARNDKLKSFSIANGVLNRTPTSVAAEVSGFPGPASSVSANGTSNAVVWNLQTDAFGTPGPAILYAHDANDVSNLLYSSAQNSARDSAGDAIKFATPMIANGHVYIGGQNEVSVYGLLNGATQAAQPILNPVSQQFHGSLQISITDSTPNAQIYYTTDGTTPSTASTLYTAPFTISSTKTVQAIAVGSGLLASTVASETYTLVNQVPTPTFSPVPGDYTSGQSVTISTTWPGSTIYYTTDGSTPTTSSNVYTGPVSISSTSTLKAIATAPNLTNSFLASGVYTIATGATSSIDFSNGFTSTGITRVGKATLSGTRLRLTNGGTTQASAAWYNTQVNVQSFSTDFMFQQVPGTTPEADGLTFCIQRAGLTAIGPYGGLAYGPATPTASGTGIPTSVAVKFDLFSGAGEGPNSTGLYTNGASPSVPAVTLGGGVDLHSGDVFAVHINYDGTTLTMTITDTVNSSQTFTTSWPINIPNTIGGNTAYVGYTAGTGHYTAVQDILSWTFVSTSGSGPSPAATPVISPATGTYSSSQAVTITDSTPGASIFYTTDGSQPTTSSTPYTGSFVVNTTTTVKAIATASGFAQSATATSVITISSQSQAATPVISPATGTYTSSQTVTITDATSGASIFYTTDGSQPTTSSTPYTGSFVVSTTTTVKAIATASGFTQSNTATSVITIQTGGGSTIDYSGGFTSSSGLQFNGRTKLNSGTLQLTDGGSGEASSAWFTTPVNVQSFTNDFTFQFINASSDGMTFTIQNAGPTALGPNGGGLGYGSQTCNASGGILTSVAIKFDLFQNCHEGNNSTGLYTNGLSPESPSVTIGNGVNLRSGNPFKVHMTYDGATLTMTITDTVTSAAFTTSWTIDIPTTVGGNTALVGFTAGTGVQTIIQIQSWAYSTSGGSNQQPAATPVISPATGTYTSSQTVTITDSTPGASIFYTTDGSQPTTSSTLYTNSFTVNSSTTVEAIATASGFTQSATATSVITISAQSQAATPVISPATGTYTSPQTVTITDSTSGASIFYTTDGSQPTTSSTPYTGSFVVSTTTTVKAIATASGFTQSNTATSVITIQTGGGSTIDYSGGFTSSSGLQFNGRTKLNSGTLQLTDGGSGEASSAWFTTPVNVQSFTNDFTFQFINASSDGMTFTIQNAGPTALGPNGGGLGYGSQTCNASGGILTSVAIKFDLFQNCHEGNNSTGLYTNGLSPESPSVTIGNGVNLRSGNPFKVHMTYDGATLTMTITDTVTSAAFTTSWTIDIPTTVGGNTALVGFTAGTGVQTIIQVTSWTYGP